MGLVPFFSFAKLLLPIAMWGMHVSIAALQHIIFVDLLFFIPAWYIWHVIDRNPGKLRPLAHAQHPWDWTQWVDDIHACWLKARAFSQGPRLFQATPRESAAILDNNHLKDKKLPDLPEDLPTPKAVVLDANPSLPHEDIIHAGARQTLLFMLVFLGVWTRGLNGFHIMRFACLLAGHPGPSFMSATLHSVVTALEYVIFTTMRSTRHSTENASLRPLIAALMSPSRLIAVYKSTSDVDARNPQNSPSRPGRCRLAGHG